MRHAPPLDYIQLSEAPHNRVLRSLTMRHIWHFNDSEKTFLFNTLTHFGYRILCFCFLCYIEIFNNGHFTPQDALRFFAHTLLLNERHVCTSTQNVTR